MNAVKHEEPLDGMRPDLQDIWLHAGQEGWQAANQRALAAALSRLRRALERWAGVAQEAAETQIADRLPGQPARSPETPPPVFERLCAAFGLTPFERDLLLLCAGIELDSDFAGLCARAGGDPSRPYPTFSLALGTLAEPHWSALSPGRPLRYWRLLEVDPAPGLALGRLRIDEHILHTLAGVPYPDERLAGLIDPLPALRGALDRLPPSHQVVAERLMESWPLDSGQAWPVIQLTGANTASKQAVAAAAAASLGLSLSALSGQLIPSTLNEIEALIRLWEREALLSGSALYLNCDDLDVSDAGHAHWTMLLIERLDSPLIVSSRERQRIRGRASLALEVPQPPAAEQRLIWEAALGQAAGLLEGKEEDGEDALARLAQFNLSPDVIQAACTYALGQLRSIQQAEQAASREPDFKDLLWNACRLQARSRLDELAQRIQSGYTWEDLVLPETQCQMLHSIAAHVRQRARVYETWGFARKSQRGLGISALFSGSSGTGKTMAAEVLGNELGLDLYRIDLSQVVSKYIGETEKNLRRVFDAAEESGAVLLFDEADALFGKRSEVKDSHDRYANIEVGYLLQRMEAYRGLAILTTNMKSALDTAFLRRIRFVVQFPFPDAAQRVEIWRRVFPFEAPVERLAYEQLGQLNVAGGNIRNIALNAAFLAADAGELVGMKHVLHAARTEYAKLEKSLTETEIAGWTG